MSHRVFEDNLQEKKASETISRRVAGRRLSDSPLLQTSANSSFLSDVMDTLQSLQ
jgi:hypothetical protein